MFSTLKQKLLLGIYVFILLSIPIGAYLASQQQSTNSRAKEQKGTKAAAQVSPKPTTSPAKQLLDNSLKELGSNPEASSSSETTTATSFGPTLSLRVAFEGRPTQNQSTRLFVGIAEGNLTSNPKFLLNFTVDLPSTGEYSNLSLAGLSIGTRYTALLKGSAQIATESAFTMSPNITRLNNDQPLNFVSGDLNDDNVINSADYSIAQKALGTTSKSAGWNENADLNKDGLINTFDLSIISKNIGKVGASGAWVSPIPKSASSSGSLTSPPLGGPGQKEGYWLWIPK